MNKNKSHIPISKNLSQQHYNIPMKRIYRIFVKKNNFNSKKKNLNGYFYQECLFVYCHVKAKIIYY